MSQNHEFDNYQHPQRRLSTSMRRNTAPVADYENCKKRDRQTSPSSVSELKQIPLTRKRVSMACDRCRKRKIKCSGQDFRGCLNCRNAGVSTCKFLRVKSKEVVLGRFTPYDLMARQHQLPPSTTVYDYNIYPQHHGHPVIVEVNAYSPVAQGMPWTRQSSYPSPTQQYEKESPGVYSMHPPSFILPNTDPMTMQSASLPPSLIARSSSNPLWLNQNLSMTQPQPSMHMLDSGYQMASEGNYGVTGLLHQNQYGQAHDRILPSPSPLRTYGSFQGGSHDNQFWTRLTQRSSTGWHIDTPQGHSQSSSQDTYASTSPVQRAYSDRTSSGYSSQEQCFDHSNIGNHPLSPNLGSVLPAEIHDVRFTRKASTAGRVVEQERYLPISNGRLHSQTGLVPSFERFHGLGIDNSAGRQFRNDAVAVGLRGHNHDSIVREGTTSGSSSADGSGCGQDSS